MFNCNSCNKDLSSIYNSSLCELMAHVGILPLFLVLLSFLFICICHPIYRTWYQRKLYETSYDYKQDILVIVLFFSFILPSLIAVIEIGITSPTGCILTGVLVVNGFIFSCISASLLFSLFIYLGMKIIRYFKRKYHR